MTRSRSERRDLLSTRFSAAYRSRLTEGLKLFWDWRVRERVFRRGWKKEPHRAARELCRFVQWCYERQSSFHVVKHAVLGIQMQYPFLRPHLGNVWQSLRSWSMEIPSRNRVPIDSTILHVLVVSGLLSAISSATAEDRLAWLMHSVLLRVGFAGLLRPREVSPCSESM